MAEIAPVDDYVADGLPLLIEVFKEKPRLEALLASYLGEANPLETVFNELFTDRAIGAADGIQLDIIGKLVGQPRVGTTDGEYTLFIRTKARANRSQGKNSDILAVMTLALNGGAFAVRDLYPASIVIDVLDPLPAFAQLIADIIAKTRAAGVGSALHFSPTYSGSATFTFASGLVEESDTAHGWSDTLNTTTGGALLSCK